MPFYPAARGRTPTRCPSCRPWTRSPDAPPRPLSIECGECHAHVPVAPKGRIPVLCAACRREANNRASREYMKGRTAHRRLFDLCILCPESDVHAALDGTDYCPDHSSASAVPAKKGITEADYDRLLAAQGGVCAGCLEPPGERRLAIDHDHKCCPGQTACGGCVRGLLCTRCNTSLGRLLDNADTLRRLADYLDHHAKILRATHLAMDLVNHPAAR